MSKCRIETHGTEISLVNGQITARFRTDAPFGLISINDHVFTDVRECAIRVATAAPRVDIPEWSFHPGSGDAVPFAEDLGYQNGFHKSTVEYGAWSGAQFLNQFPIGLPGYSPVVYPGYGWYRCKFEMPPLEPASAAPVEFVLGGSDSQDWQEYRVYLNGEPIGCAQPEGVWHNAPKFILAPGDPRYGLIKFGETNVLAVQVRGLDRTTPEMVVSDAERYSTGSYLVDQYVSIGPATRELIVLAPTSHRLERSDALAAIEFEFAGDGISGQIRYWITSDEPILHKRIFLQNASPYALTLLELDLHRGTCDAALSSGGIGSPCSIGDDLFCVIRHPAGVNRGDGRTLSLSMYPGRTLAPGETYESKVVLFGATPRGEALQGFLRYLETHGPRRRELRTIFSSYGIYDVAGIDEPTNCTEELLLRNLDDLDALRQKGISFDFYFIDTGWNDPNGDLKDFDPKFWPDGPARALARIRALDMKLGLWMSPASGAAAFHPGIYPPRLSGCGTMRKGTGGNPDKYRGPLCLATEPWKSEFRAALLHQTDAVGAKGFKFDGCAFQCTNPAHDHLPGKYSVEALMDAHIEVLQAVRSHVPDIVFMFYWGVQSPLWLLYGDAIYERGILMEGSTPADIPTRLLRQSITLSYDQAAHHAWDHVPISSGDSLGVWISKWRWANYICAEGWRDAWVMEIARGSLMHQLWGDLGMFSEEDVAFLAEISAWVRATPCLLGMPARILGDPWKAEPYGYRYADASGEAVFAFNPTFEPRMVEIQFRGNAVVVYSSDQPFRPAIPLVPSTASGILSIELKPFEVRILERAGSASPTGSQHDTRINRPAELRASPFRETLREEIAWDDARFQHEIRRMVCGRSQYVDSDAAFRNVRFRSDERDTITTRRQFRASATVAPISGPRTLLVTASLARDGIYWHHHALFDIIRLRSTIDGREIAFRTTPHRWHEEAGGWSWILFEAPLTASDSARGIEFEAEAFLPASITIAFDFHLLHE